MRPLQAFRAGGRGDVTKSHFVFAFQHGPDVPTPVTDGKYFYSVTDNGVITSRNPGDLEDFSAKIIEEVSEGRHNRRAA